MQIVMQFKGQPWASVRAHVWFYNVTDAVWRETLWQATQMGMCTGGYSTAIYASVADMMKTANLHVGRNSKSKSGLGHVKCLVACQHRMLREPPGATYMGHCMHALTFARDLAADGTACGVHTGLSGVQF